MYVTPRPDAVEDPLYGIRLGLTGALAYAAIPIIDPLLPPIIAALPVGLIAAQRRTLDLGKLIGGALAMMILPWIMTWLVVQMRPMPLVYVLVMWWFYFIGFRMILVSGAQAGMLIVIVAVLISVMGMHGTAIVETLRNGFMQAALVTLVVGPIVYLLTPPRTRERHVDTPTPGHGNATLGAAIRATVLIGLSFWLYAVMQPSDMMMAVVAAMVLVFPSRKQVFSEAMQRIRATVYGGAVAMLILMLFLFSQHLLVLLGLIFLGGLWFGQKMLFGPRQSMVYQYGFSVTLALVAGALSTQDAAYATMTRIVLTLAGALTAALSVALLDQMTGWRSQAAG